MWVLDDDGNKLNGFPFTKPVDPTGWLATSYALNADVTGDGVPEFDVLWAKPGTGQANLWLVNGATGTKLSGLPLTKPVNAAGWTATAHWPNGDGTFQLVWSSDAGGKANIWTVEAATGDKLDGVPLIKPGEPAGWQALSYASIADVNQDGEADFELLWAKPGTGQANLWTIDGVTGGKLSGVPLVKPIDPAGWTARAHWPNGDGTYDLVWGQDAGGQINLWTLDSATGSKLRGFPLTKPTDPAGWIVTGYVKPAAVAVTLAQPAERDVIVTIKKQGDGQGTIVAGEQVCDIVCTELMIPYTSGTTVQLQVVPAAGSRFVGWEDANSLPVAQILYAHPGETVFAVFDPSQP